MSIKASQISKWWKSTQEMWLETYQSQAGHGGAPLQSQHSGRGRGQDPQVSKAPSWISGHTALTEQTHLREHKAKWEATQDATHYPLDHSWDAHVPPPWRTDSGEQGLQCLSVLQQPTVRCASCFISNSNFSNKFTLLAWQLPILTLPSRLFLKELCFRHNLKWSERLASWQATGTHYAFPHFHVENYFHLYYRKFLRNKYNQLNFTSFKQKHNIASL